MKNRKGLLVAGIVAMWASFVAPAHAQLPPCSAGNNTGGRAIAERLADWAATYLSEEDPNRQAEAPSLAENSSAQSDSAKPTDVATLSLNPAATTTNSRTPKSTDVSTSFSLAALAAGITQQSPLGSGFYGTSLAAKLRRFAFSATDSFPGQSSATVSKGSETYGLKFQIYSRLNKAREALKAYFETLAALNPDFQVPANLDVNASPIEQDLTKIRAYVVTQLVTRPTVMGLEGQPLDREGAEQKTASTADIDRAVACGLAAKDGALDSLLKQTAEHLLANAGMTAEIKKNQNGPEFAIESSARLSKGTSPNVYRNQLDYSQAFAKKTLTNTINLGFDFQNAQMAATRNRNIARFVEQIQFPFNIYHRDVKNGRLKLAVGGEGDWGSNGPPMYKGLGKLTVTAFAGCDIPIAVNYVNRTTGVNRGDIRAQVGIAFDFTKLWVRPPKPVEAALE